jgi:hypothetical protein
VCTFLQSNYKKLYQASMITPACINTDLKFKLLGHEGFLYSHDHYQFFLTQGKTLNSRVRSGRGDSKRHTAPVSPPILHILSISVTHTKKQIGTLEKPNPKTKITTQLSKILCYTHKKHTVKFQKNSENETDCAPICKKNSNNSNYF